MYKVRNEKVIVKIFFQQIQFILVRKYLSEQKFLNQK